MTDVLKMNHCISVELNNPWTLNKEQNLPKRTADKLPVPWILSALKILLMLVAMFNMRLETTPINSGGLAGFMIFQSLATIPDLVVYALFIFEACRGEDDYKDIRKFVFIAFLIRCFLLLGGIVCSAAADNISFVYLSATLGYIIIEYILWCKHANHYRLQFISIENMLIADLRTNFGEEHQLGQEVNCELYTMTSNLEERFWNGTPAAERDQSIYPENLFWQRKDGRVEYFVGWDSYSTINERIKLDFNIMDDLVEDNAVLRNDLIRQNQLISQMKRKIDGVHADCSEHNQLPDSPASVGPWYPAIAEGLFFVSKGTTGLYVKLSEYRWMADHAVLLRKSIPLLNQERRELTAALQIRKTMNNELVVKLLAREFREDEVIEQIRMDDVD